MTEDLREALFNSWDRLQSSFQLLEILSENYQLDERKDDKRRRELIENFFNLLISSVSSAKVTIVEKYGSKAIQIDWSEELKQKFMILFCVIPDDVNSRWVKEEKTIEINFSNNSELVNILFYRSKFEEIIREFKPEIYSELANYFDYEKYMITRPFIFDSHFFEGFNERNQK